MRRKYQHNAVTQCTARLVGTSTACSNRYDAAALSQLPSEACYFTYIAFHPWIDNHTRCYCKNTTVSREIFPRVSRGHDLTLHMLLQIVCNLTHPNKRPCLFVLCSHDSTLPQITLALFPCFFTKK